MTRRHAGAHPEPVDRLIDALATMPGIGRRSAMRLAFHLLKSSTEEARALADAIIDVKEKVMCCSICWHLTDVDPCVICGDSGRDGGTILVVEQPRDLMSLEATGMFRGVYHVLTGRLDPLAGVETGDLTIERLLERIDDPSTNSGGVQVTEVILGLSPNLEGDSTGLFLAEALASRSVHVTRLARGLPTGSQLEYASTAVLADAIQGRQNMSD